MQVCGIPSVSDSKATFTAKAKGYGVPESTLSRWATVGIETYSQLLFRVASSPGAVDQARLEALRREMDPSPPAEATKAAVARLLFEAGTFIVSELRATVETPTESSRRLSARVQAKLGDYRVTGTAEPSNTLVDKCSSMLADQRLSTVSRAARASTSA